jgi:uncharacterized damage-inducible protein DinB
MTLLGYLRTQVRANRLSNHRLHRAMAALPGADFHAPRTGFFPSLAGTLDHILLVDRYYLDCLHGRADARERALAHVACATLAGLAAQQAGEDERFIALLDAATPDALQRTVEMPRRDHVQREPMANVVAHLLAHQVHHRGQAHAMLSGTGVAPPQLDEFLMRSEAHLRHADLQQLGWSEALLFPAD